MGVAAPSCTAAMKAAIFIGIGGRVAGHEEVEERRAVEAVLARDLDVGLGGVQRVTAPSEAQDLDPLIIAIARAAGIGDDCLPARGCAQDDIDGIEIPRPCRSPDRSGPKPGP